MRALRLHEQELVDQAYAKQVRRQDDDKRRHEEEEDTYMAWLET